MNSSAALILPVFRQTAQHRWFKSSPCLASPHFAQSMLRTFCAAGGLSFIKCGMILARLPLHDAHAAAKLSRLFPPARKRRREQLRQCSLPMRHCSQSHAPLSTISVSVEPHDGHSAAGHCQSPSSLTSTGITAAQLWVQTRQAAKVAIHCVCFFVIFSIRNARSSLLSAV